MICIVVHPPMAKSPRQKRKAVVPVPQKRQIGFLCHYCRLDVPWNERFLPFYYRPPEGHRVDPNCCFACFAEKRHKGRPALSAHTLRQFWREDVSDGPSVKAAAKYFRCTVAKIREVMEEIRI